MSSFFSLPSAPISAQLAGAAQVASAVFDAFNRTTIVPQSEDNPAPSFGQRLASSLLGLGGGITLQTFVNMNISNRMQITDHPVEASSVISDHAIALPRELQVTAVFSASSIMGAVQNISNFFASGELESKLVEVRQNLEAMRESKQLVTINTPRGIFENMLIQSTQYNLTRQNFNVLEVTIGLREVILVKTSSTNIDPKTIINPANADAVNTGGNPVKRSALNASTPTQYQQQTRF